jgi:hypothetical protein
MIDIGDIPGGAVAQVVISHASAASDGAGAALQGAGGAAKWRAPQACRIVGAWWEPHGADSDAANTLSYRNLTLVDGGAAAAGIATLASLALTASLGSNVQRALSLVASPTVDAGDVVYASHLTVGGNHSAGTVLVAGQFRFNYRPI